MNITTPLDTAKSPALPDATSLGPVALNVADLDRAEQFYTGVLGLRPSPGRSALDLTLTAPESRDPLLHLHRLPNAGKKPAHSTGLYHAALLVPERADLARILRRLISVKYPLQGASDHLVSEALYLDDPDGNGLEIYYDRPRSEWPRSGNGALRMATNPFDASGVLTEASEEGGLAAGTTIGHVHLQVADIKAADAFYHGLLGFDRTVSLPPSALFVSSGGYHHHLGLNTWTSAGAAAPPVNSVGLRWFTIRLPDEIALDAAIARLRNGGRDVQPFRDAPGWFVRDGSGNGMVLTTAP